MCNWRDNPWHKVLESERVWDYENLPRALYDHIWEGDFNDSVENALIQAEWFDACVDAHLALGFEPLGARMAAHDPSDMGEDPKGYAFRHGSVVTRVEKKEDGDVNEGGDWATGLAINDQADTFTWDGDGMGVGLNRQVTDVFEGKHTILSVFKGSMSPDLPEAIFSPSEKGPLQNPKTNKEAFVNKRAQYYYFLRERVYKTYRAVIHKEYSDPDTLISFSSEMTELAALRSELCRMPIKPNANGRFELYKKVDMKTRFKFPSPNLADSVMMLMRPVHQNVVSTFRPLPIRTMGRR
jgi:phage terminase large subunit